MCYAPLPSREVNPATSPVVLPVEASKPVDEPVEAAIAEPVVEPVAEPVAEPIVEFIEQMADLPATPSEALAVDDPPQDDVADTDAFTNQIQIEPYDGGSLDEAMTDDTPVEPEPASFVPSEPTLSDSLPDFLRYGAVKRRRGKRKSPHSRRQTRMHRIVGLMLVLMILALSYAAWLYKPMVASKQQAAKATAARLALAINERDYDELFRSTIWTEHYRHAFRNSADINRFCLSPNTAKSVILHNLAEMWQMKHTVVVSGKLIGQNSIGYTFVDTSNKQRKYQFTLTHTTSNRWMWDIAYD